MAKMTAVTHAPVNAVKTAATARAQHNVILWLASELRLVDSARVTLGREVEQPRGQALDGMRAQLDRAWTHDHLAPHEWVLIRRAGRDEWHAEAVRE